jgi:hypothetical protein
MAASFDAFKEWWAISESSRGVSRDMRLAMLAWDAAIHWLRSQPAPTDLELEPDLDLLQRRLDALERAIDFLVRVTDQHHTRLVSVEHHPTSPFRPIDDTEGSC